MDFQLNMRTRQDGTRPGVCDRMLHKTSYEERKERGSLALDARIEVAFERQTVAQSPDYTS